MYSQIMDRFATYYSINHRVEKISHPSEQVKIRKYYLENGRNFKIFLSHLGAYRTTKIIFLKLGENCSKSSIYELRNVCHYFILYALKAHILYYPQNFCRVVFDPQNFCGLFLGVASNSSNHSCGLRAEERARKFLTIIAECIACAYGAERHRMEKIVRFVFEKFSTILHKGM